MPLAKRTLVLNIDIPFSEEAPHSHIGEPCEKGLEKSRDSANETERQSMFRRESSGKTPKAGRD